MSELKEITVQRGSEYGDYRHQAALSQKLKDTIREHVAIHGVDMEPYQYESIDMILLKISRIVSGNPNNLDSWLDIAGYATIAYERLPRPNETPVSSAKAGSRTGTRKPLVTG